MRFTFHPMTEADARAILAWRYDGLYAVYNMVGNDEATLAELLDPRSPYFAARDKHGELVGFFAFGSAAEVGNEPAAPALLSDNRILSVGLGLRPDLTGHGKGIGLSFVNAGLKLARERFHPAGFRLFVLAFNQRAARVYEEAGFTRVGIRHVHNIHGAHDFIEMRRDA